MGSRSKTYHHKPDTRSGFTLVEVLIATLIMVVSIVTVTAAIRQFAIHREKLGHYEQIYTTTLSLRDRIMNETLSDNLQNKGSLNGLEYHYECKLVESANSYVYDMDAATGGGNTGPFLVMLYKVSLDVGGKTVEFYKTQYKKRFDTSQEAL